MPGKVGVKIKAGRNLPIMDKGSETTDAYVEIKLGGVTHKTDVCRKSLNPQWNTDWFRFEVDDADLQDEPLQIRVMDHDTYSANDAIGKVNISLNPLCLETASQGKSAVLSGWIPVFDTMHGIRGEVNVIVKVDLFSDLNKFRQSSCGVRFFHSPCIPHGYRAQVIHGFVEELVVNDDPEYQWIDKIRTPRASNEARQVVFLRLSGQVQRKIGLKATNLGANAVVGYRQCFDLEGDVGVVARGIGTAVTLVRIQETSKENLVDNTVIEEQTLKYLEFLTRANDPCNDYFTTGETISGENKLHISQPSDDSVSDTSNMRSLLRQEEQRHEKPQKKFKHHVKRIKNQSYLMINKKCGALKKKLRDADKSDNETKSLSSSLSTVSVIEPLRSSLMDLRNAVGLGKSKTPRHHIIRSISDATGMAAQKTPLTFEQSMHEAIHSSPSIITPEKRSDTRDTSISSESITNEGMRNAQATEPDSITIITEESGEMSSLGELRDAREEKLGNLVNKEDLDIILKTFALKDGFVDDANLNISSSSSSSTSDDSDDDNDSADDEADEMNWMQPGTSADDFDCEVEEQRASLLHDLRDNIAIKYHQLQECMHRSTRSPDKQKPKDQAKSSTQSGDSKEQSPPRPPEIIIVESVDDRTDCFSPEPVIPTTVMDLLHQTDANAPDEKLNQLAPTTQKIKDEQDRSKPIDYYSSEPELSADDNTAVANPRRSSFISLKSVPQRSMNKLSNRSAVASPTKLCTKFSSPILQICPPTPTPTESESSPAETQSPGRLLPNSSMSPSSYLSVNTLKNSNSDWSLSNKPINHSHSLVTLSNHTNSASLLAPSTPLPIKHHRSSTDVASSIGNGIAADGSATILASSPVTKPVAPLSAAATVGLAGHIRNDSSASKTSPSPSKVIPQGNSIPPSSAAAVAAAMAAVSSAKDIEICRRSSDSDLSITPKGNSICVPSERLMQATAQMRHNTAISLKTNLDNLDMLEYPFLTLTKYPPGFILQLGPTCSSRSVKLLERVPNPDEPETRDSWWTEIRMEVRSHARAACCNVVLGYTETTTICDDVCVLTAFGTGAVINVMYNRTALHMELPIVKPANMSTSLDDHDIIKDLKDVSLASTVAMSNSYTGPQKPSNPNPSQPNSKYDCTMCHVPYNRTTVPFPVKTRKCAICRKGRVPDIFLTTIEIPDSLQMTGRGCLIQATIVRPKKDLRSESNAKEISDGLPFLEYELHRVLVNKLKSKGMNSIFSFKAKVSIGDRMITLVATGTAVYITALPPPDVPKIVGTPWTDRAKLTEVQRTLQETFERNREIYQLKSLDPDCEPVDRQSDTDESDDEMVEIDWNTGHKDACLLEVDDIEDVEIISQLTEPVPPKGFHVVNTQSVPGLHDMEIVRNLQFFTQVWRAKASPNLTSKVLGAHFNRLCQTIYFKLRSMAPCAICDVRFLLDLAEGDEIQLLITGMALGLGEVNKFKNRRKTVNDVSTSNKKSQDEEFIFTLDEDQLMESLPSAPSTSAAAASSYGNYSLKLKKGSPGGTKLAAGSRAIKPFPLRERYGIDITPLTYIPGGKIEKYLGNLNFFFIRESTSLRELGGISGFLHSFITELLAVVRAHITVLGGNAMVSFYMTELILDDNQHKGQAQCLVSVGGDVVYVSYHPDD